MGAGVAVRYASPADAPLIARIHAESWRRHYRGMYSDAYLDGDLVSERTATWNARLARPADRHFTLIAEERGEPIGFTHVSLDGDAKWGALVDNLHVSHAARGKGVGSELLEWVSRIVGAERPGAGVFLWVLELNEQAKGFYLARGGTLRDSEPSAPPAGDPRNLHGAPNRVRATWASAEMLMRAPARKVRWGVLGAANIALKKVIPGMQRGTWSEVAAIASRDGAKARAAADSLGIPTAHASYEALLDDPSIEAVYVPLPNHLHVPWTVRAADRGKHVLCEKPIALDAKEAESLLAARDRNRVKIMEAFMIRSHPQWIAAVGMAQGGALGRVQSIVSHFSYDNTDPRNVRNVREMGGGGLLDIGCYLTHTARWIMGAEPRHVASAIEIDPRFGVDRLASMLMDFGGAQAIATCGTQMVPSQRVHIFGGRAHLEIEIPFNAPPDRRCRVFVREGGRERTIEFPVCDQYTLQGDGFSRAIRGAAGQVLSLEDSIGNLGVLDMVATGGRE